MPKYSDFQSFRKPIGSGQQSDLQRLIRKAANLVPRMEGPHP